MSNQEIIVYDWLTLDHLQEPELKKDFSDPSVVTKW